MANSPNHHSLVIHTLNIIISPDFYEKLMAVTVVEEGKEVVLNCTPTLNVDVIITGPDEVLQKFPPVNYVLIFPANLSYQGNYGCSIAAGSEVGQFTFVAVLPGNLSQIFIVFCISLGREGGEVE